MSKKRRSTLTVAIYGVSVALHVALAAAAVLAPKVKKTTSVAISLSEAPKPPPKKDEPPPPPPPPPVKAKAAPAAVAAPKAAAEPPAKDPTPPPSSGAADSFADLGLTMGNGGAGLAVPTGPRPPAPPAERETTRQVRTLSAKREVTCDEQPVKAKLRGALVKAEYTAEARAAQIEGVVRVELTIDEQGNVIAVKVLRGLGYGLDESATKAARKMTFEPGTLCGKPAVTKMTVRTQFSQQ